MIRITGIHQIEITSRCNLACPYCIHGTPGALLRPAQDISEDNWHNALDWVRFYCTKGTQGELNLAGIGESTLHPRFAEMVAEAREVVGVARPIIFATNGVALPQKMIDALVPSKPLVWVSMHAPSRAAHAIQALKAAGILSGVSLDGAVNPNNWAGQVDWIQPVYRMPCPWLRQGWGFVASTGTILACCIDAGTGSKIDHVRTIPHDIYSEGGPLCSTCYQDP